MRIIPFPRQQGQGLRRILSKSCKRRGAIPSSPPLSGRHRQMQHAILQSLRSKKYCDATAMCAQTCRNPARQTGQGSVNQKRPPFLATFLALCTPSRSSLPALVHSLLLPVRHTGKTGFGESHDDASGNCDCANNHKGDFHAAPSLAGRSLKTLNTSWLSGNAITHAVRKISMESVQKPICF